MWNLNPAPDQYLPLRCIASINVLLYADEVKLACERRLKAIETQIGKRIQKLATDYARGKPSDQVRLNAFLRSINKDPSEYIARRRADYLEWVEDRTKGDTPCLWHSGGITDKDIETLEKELNSYGELPSQLRELAKKCEEKIESNAHPNMRPLMKVSVRELSSFVDLLDPAPIDKHDL